MSKLSSYQIKKSLESLEIEEVRLGSSEEFKGWLFVFKLEGEEKKHRERNLVKFPQKVKASVLKEYFLNTIIKQDFKVKKNKTKKPKKHIFKSK